MLRLLLGLLPVLAMSAYNVGEGEGDDDGNDDAGDEGASGDATGNNGEKTFTQADIDRIIASEKRKLRNTLRTEVRDEVKAELEAERERKQQEEAEEFRPLYETEKEKREAAEREAQEIEARYRQRIVRSEIKVAAQGLNFHKPDVAWKLIDHDAVEFDEEGEPTNVEALVKAVADEHPYLIQSEEGRVRSVEHSRSNGGGEITRDQIKNKYLEQAGVKPR